MVVTAFLRKLPRWSLISTNAPSSKHSMRRHFLEEPTRTKSKMHSFRFAISSFSDGARWSVCICDNYEKLKRLRARNAIKTRFKAQLIASLTARYLKGLRSRSSLILKAVCQESSWGTVQRGNCPRLDRTVVRKVLPSLWEEISGRFCWSAVLWNSTRLNYRRKSPNSKWI